MHRMKNALSDTVTAKLRECFTPQDQERATELLLKYGSEGERAVERIHLDVLYACNSSLEKLEQLINLAKFDFRDLILEVEYDRVKGKNVSKPQFAEAHRLIDIHNSSKKDE